MISSQVFASTGAGEKLSAIVRRVTFHSQATGWTVLKVTTAQRPNEEIAVTVHQCKVFAGATMEFFGNWVNHPEYGWQFKAEKAVEKKPASIAALEKYLGSGLIKGVGPVTAKAIVKHFKKQTLEVFDTEIDKLTQVSGIAEKKLEMIQKAWVEHRQISNVVMFLQQHDISTLFAVKIYKTYGDDSIKIVQENPYRLAQDIYGIGFFSSDRIAQSLGVEFDSPKRIKAGIDHVLQASREEGHCYLTQEQVEIQTKKLLEEKSKSELEQLEIMIQDQKPIEKEKIAQVLQEMETADELKVRVMPVVNSLGEEENGQELTQKCYYAKSVYFDENNLARRILEMNKKQKIEKEKIYTWLENFYKKKQIQLSKEQEAAVLSILQRQVSVLTGGPGCGKTTTIKVLVAALLSMKKKVLLAAPTGRAAQRMTEVIGLQAKTIHRLLEFDPSQGGFKKKEEEPLQTDFLILDETSMLDIHLASAVIRAVPKNAQLLLIGDVDQLPSVGAGNVLKDIINSDKVNVCRLTKVFRQAQESLIIKYAHQINSGLTPKIDSPFREPLLWQKKQDCLFIDAEELTSEQMKFVAKVRRHFASFPDKFPKKQENLQELKELKKGSKNRENLNQKEEENPLEMEEEFILPSKFAHVEVERLLESQNQIEELKLLLKKIHPWSALNYNLTATDMIRKLYLETIPKYLGKTEIQILSPMTRGSLGSRDLNLLVQKAANPFDPNKAQILIGSRIFRLGDRVIQKVNNYDLNVFNGDIGRIVEIDNEEMVCTVEYKSGLDTRIVDYEKETLAEIDLAYAITIHKSQGSEFGVVIIPVTTQHFNMLQRNLIYTGLTRAKKMAILVGSRKALSMAVRNQSSRLRQTGLLWLLENKNKI